MTKNTILECMRNDPDIVCISETGLKRTPVQPGTQILTGRSLEVAISLLKYMEEKGINFPEDKSKIKRGKGYKNIHNDKYGNK